MLKKIFSSELGKGALILFITINLYNFLNFLFHFSMGRLLGPADYGVLAVLMSLIYLFGIPTEAIQNIIAKYSSKFNSTNEKGKIKFLMDKSLKKGFKIAFCLFIIAGIISIFLSKFLEINFFLILLTNIFIFSSFSVPVTRGVLQGRKKFNALGNNMLLESILKLFFAISFVIFGFKTFGAMGGVLFGVGAGFVFSLYFNKDILKVKKEETTFKNIYGVSKPYFIAMFVILIALSLDIILAKRFFSPEIAGQYAVLSMLGKMIYFGTFAISKAMFPLTSEKKENKEDSSSLFKKSFVIILFLCICATTVFFLFPELIINILYGQNYSLMAPYLGYSALALSFLSLSNLVLIYKLSINKLKKSYFLIIFLAIEILLLSLFHSSILEYIFAFMVSNIIIFIGSFFVK